MKEVDELVEWAKKQLEGYGYGVPVPFAEEMVKAILSHPDLALIDRERALPDATKKCAEAADRGNKEGTAYVRGYYMSQSDMFRAGYLPVIPLAPALKEK